MYWIALAREYGCRLVNATDGGEGMKNLTDEARAKHRAAVRGRQVSTETRAKISLSLQGRKHTSVAISRMQFAKSGENHPLFGKSPSSETRVKLRAGMLRHWAEK